MKHLFLLAAMLLCLLSAGAQEPQESQELQKGREHLGRRAARRAEGAHLLLERTDHDFGDIARRGGEVTTVVRFRNDGTAPLVLTRVTTTCTCLKVDYSKRPVPANGSGEIRLTYQPLKADPGTFNKVVQVLSNSSSGREIITIRGNSLEQ